MNEKISELHNIQMRQEAALPEKLRRYEMPINSRGLLLLGARGVGKTTFLLTRARELRKILYVSVDTPLFSSVWEIGEAAFAEGFEGIFFDEVHFAQNWERDIKALYDAHPKKQIWASDSSSATLRLDGADLSRRFPCVELPILSLREYIFLKDGLTFSKLNPFAEAAENTRIAAELLGKYNLLSAFNEYLQNGTRPFFQEGSYEARINAIIEKMIYSDIPFFVSQIRAGHFRMIQSIVHYIARSKIPTLNLEKLCSEWEISRSKLYELLAVMEEVRLIRTIRFRHDYHARSKGAKIFLYEPTMYSPLADNIGCLRECFVSLALSVSGHNVFAAKDERAGDFDVDGVGIVEIGGKSKKMKSSDWVIKDGIDLPSGNAIPMWMFGMGW